jgi:lysophospholipase L1-like esterase
MLRLSFVRFVFFVALVFQLSASAAEPQWIWRHKGAATKAEPETVYFRKVFDVETPDGGVIEITADNTFEVYLNGRRLGTGDNWRQRSKFDIGPLLVPGRNVIAVAASNSAADSAGLAVHLVAQNKGQAPVEVSSDDSWKWSLKVPGTWARLESDDSQWETAVVLGPYGRTAPWGAAGQVVDGKPAVPVLNKPRSREKGLFEFRDGDRVVFLGSGFIERLQNTGYLETMITAAFPHKKITFRNLGWSGDTVRGDARAGFGTRADGFARLVSDVAMCDPTVLLICYGENEAHAGNAGLADFRAGLNTLLDVLERTGARIVLLGPRQHENLGPPLPDPAKYNADLRKYNNVIGQVAKEREHRFVDLFGVEFANQNGKESVKKGGFPAGRFGDPSSPLPLTENGIALSSWGDFQLSRELAAILGVQFRHSIEIDLNTMDYVATNTSIVKAAKNDRAIELEFLDLSLAWAVGEADSGEGPPLKSFLRIRAIDAPGYSITSGGKEIGTFAGTFIPSLDIVHNPRMNGHAAAIGAQVAELSWLINEKNALFFHRYRPQNETYLFLFRKHEQGNNAVEIPQFDPLIEELEKKIDELKKPVKQKFELIKVK